MFVVFFLVLSRHPGGQAVLEEQRKKELQAVIQAHFKEWLVNSGNMRQIYDLARLEREEG